MLLCSSAGRGLDSSSFLRFPRPPFLQTPILPSIASRLLLLLTLRTQLLDDIPRVLPRQRDVLCVAPPREDLVAVVAELDLREGEGFADYG